MDHPRPWLKYVEAGDLDDSTIDFDNLDVENPAGEKLGKVNGFILDADTGHPYHIVVDSRGWFKSKHYLLPIGHGRLDFARRLLVADLTRDRITRFPGFDLARFEKWSEEDFARFNKETADACCVDVTVVTTEPAEDCSTASHYRRPDWWDSSYYRPDREPSVAHDKNAR
jgi:PRC-barrel domain